MLEMGNSALLWCASTVAFLFIDDMETIFILIELAFRIHLDPEMASLSEQVSRLCYDCVNICSS